MAAVTIIEKEKIKFVTWLLGFYLLFAPLDFLPVIPGVSLSRFMIFIPVVGWLLYIKHIKIRLDRYLFIPVFYVLITMISIFYSYDNAASMQRFITISLNIGSFLVLSMLSYNNKEINILKMAIVCSGWLTLVLMIFYSQEAILSGLRIAVVVNGTYQDPNYLNGFLIFAIIYYYDNFIKNSKKRSLLKLSVFLIFILLTGSRGGLLAVLGAILCYTFIWSMNEKLNLYSILRTVGIFLIFAVFFTFAMNVLPETIVNRYNASSVVESGGTGRTIIWEKILEQYNNLPILNKMFGGGAGTTKYFTGGSASHNIWLESLIEMGIIGTFILFSFYYVFIKKAYKMKEYIVVASFFGYIILGLSLSLNSYRPIWNIILLILILKNYEIQSRFRTSSNK